MTWFAVAPINDGWGHVWGMVWGEDTWWELDVGAASWQTILLNTSSWYGVASRSNTWTVQSSIDATWSDVSKHADVWSSVALMNDGWGYIWGFVWSEDAWISATTDVTLWYSVTGLSGIWADVPEQTGASILHGWGSGPWGSMNWGGKLVAATMWTINASINSTWTKVA